MSLSVNLFPQNFHGCKQSDKRTYPLHTELRGQSSVMAMSVHRKASAIKCHPEDSIFSSSNDQRTNPNFSRHRRQIWNRSRERREGSENFIQPGFLSKNSSASSLSNSPDFQATSSPGPREKEILELFRKVQRRLRERNAAKKVSRAEVQHPRDSATVDSFISILRRHSTDRSMPEKSSGMSYLNSVSKDDIEGQNAVASEPLSNLYGKPTEEWPSFSEICTSEGKQEDDASEYEYDEHGVSFSGDLKEATGNEEIAGEADEDSGKLDEDNKLITDKMDGDEDKVGEYDDGREVDGDEDEVEEYDDERDSELDPHDYSSVDDDGEVVDEAFEGYDEEDGEDDEVNGAEAYQHGFSEDMEDGDDEMNGAEAHHHDFSEDMEDDEYGGEAGDDGWEGELSSYTVPQLKMLAKKRGLKGFSRMKKTELLGLLCGSV